MYHQRVKGCPKTMQMLKMLKIHGLKRCQTNVAITFYDCSKSIQNTLQLLKIHSFKRIQTNMPIDTLSDKSHINKFAKISIF